MNYQNYEVIATSKTVASDQESDSGLRVSSYDRVAAMLVAMLFLVGFVTTVLFLMWICHETTLGPSAVEVTERQPISLDEPAALVLDEPSPSEIEHRRGADLEIALTAVTDVVSKTLAGGDLDQAFCEHPVKTARRIGPPTDLPYRRWQIRFETKSLDEYARQLDEFGIELGVAGGGIKHVDYAREFTGSVSHRTGKGGDEKRFYMVWQDGTLQRFDRQLLERAGIPVSNRVIMHFYSPEMLSILTQLEEEAAAGEVADLRKTVFGIRKTTDSYEFFVVSQF